MKEKIKNKLSKVYESFKNKVIEERWHLHIIVGVILGLFLTSIMGGLGLFKGLRYADLLIITFVIGTIIGWGFEIFQANNSGKYVRKYDILYELKILSKTSKTKVDYTDAIATGIGYMIPSLILGLLL
jgi:amino acid transporter